MSWCPSLCMALRTVNMRWAASPEPKEAEDANTGITHSSRVADRADEGESGQRRARNRVCNKTIHSIYKSTSAFCRFLKMRLKLTNKCEINMVSQPLFSQIGYVTIYYHAITSDYLGFSKIVTLISLLTALKDTCSLNCLHIY